MESGNVKVGFKHILSRHPVSQFASFGVATEAELSELLVHTISNNIPVGTIGNSGTVYKIGEKFLNIVISSNGYIVDAYNVTNDIARIVFY